MDEVRSKQRYVYFHQWNCLDGLPVVRVENGIVGLIEKLTLRIGLFEGNAPIRFQGDNFYQSEAKNTFGLDVANDEMSVSYIRLDDAMRREDNLLLA